jgi:RNA polymerase sigma-70 factor (ECF subfamily)
MSDQFDPRPERYRSALLLLARALLARQPLADRSASDLVQDTLLEAHRDLGQFRGGTEEELFAWLRKMLRHAFLDACDRARAGKRDVARKTLEADLTVSFAGLDELLIAPDTSPSERAARNEELNRLADALLQLPADQHEAVSLRDVVGLPLADVARRMGRTPAAVAGLLFRGRKRLQDLLGEG